MEVIFGVVLSRYLQICGNLLFINILINKNNLFSFNLVQNLGLRCIQESVFADLDILPVKIVMVQWRAPPTLFKLTYLLFKLLTYRLLCSYGVPSLKSQYDTLIESLEELRQQYELPFTNLVLEPIVSQLIDQDSENYIKRALLSLELLLIEMFSEVQERLVRSLISQELALL